MEESELKNLWQQYDKKLEMSLELNLRNFEAIQTQKAKSKLRLLVIQKLIGIVLGIAWVLFLAWVVYYNLALSKIFFVISVGMIMLITTISIVVYLKHLVLINQINYSESITDTQKKIALLQSSIINIVRISFLQIPFYTTFYINNSMIQNGNAVLWIIQIIITISFIILTVWLYKNISYKNIHRKWLKILLGGSGWTSVTKAMEFLDEIDEFKI